MPGRQRVNRYLRSRLKQRWARLTDGDLESVEVQAARLVALLQARYGYTRQQAERELLAGLEDSVSAGLARGEPGFRTGVNPRMPPAVREGPSRRSDRRLEVGPEREVSAVGPTERNRQATP
jgi:hypothetical protein